MTSVRMLGPLGTGASRDRRHGLRPSYEPLTEPSGSHRALRRPPNLHHIDARLSSLTALLVLGDVAIGAVAVLVAPLPRSQTVLLVGLLLCFRLAARLYRQRLRLSSVDDVPRAVASVLAALVTVVAIDVLVLGISPHDKDLLSVSVGLLVAAEIHRWLTLGVASLSRRRWSGGERTLVVGADRVPIELAQTMLEHPEFGLRPVGLLGGGVEATQAGLPFPRMMDGDLAEIVPRHGVTTVVIADPVGEAEAVDAALTCHRLGCSVLVLPRLFELVNDGHRIERIRSYPLIRLAGDPTRRLSWKAKRAIDVAVAAMVTIALLPLLACVALGVWLDLGRSVIFAQERIGRGGRPFRIYKFRTLDPRSDHEADTTWSIEDDPRVSRFGRFLRRTSIDELPQIWNVLRGEMSLVGPRPERPIFVEEFSAEHRRYAARHRVPAGLTGLAQVNGLRGNTSIADRARYDNYYIASWSLWLDLRILISTTGELLRRGRG